MAIAGVLTAGLLIGLLGPARANVTPDPAACLAQLPAASQAFFQGCSCSGTTLLIDFPAGGEARANDPLCTPATSTTSTATNGSASTATGTQTKTNEQSGSEGAQGEATYTVTQQTQGSGVDDWLDGVDPISGPYWITSQTGRFNNRSLPNQQTNARLAEIARELARLRAERVELRQQLDRNIRRLKKAQEQRGDAGNPFALIFGGLVGQSTTANEASIRSLLEAGQQFRRQLLGLDEQIKALESEQDQLETSVPGPFQSPVGSSFAAVDTFHNWAISHGAAESPWRHFSGHVTLNDIRRHMAHRRYLLAQAADGRPVADRFQIPDLIVDQRFNAWIAGSYTWTDDDRAGAKGDSTNGQVTLGASYVVSETINAGVQIRYRRIESDRNDGTASSAADGFGGAVFAQILLAFGMAVTPVIAYEHTMTDLTQVIGGTGLTGSFGADIWTFGTQFAQRFDIHDDGAGGIYWVEPRASLSYVSAYRESYVRSDGVLVPADTVNDGSLTFGGKIGAEFLAPGTRISALAPSFGINGVWNFDRPGDQLLTTGSTIATPDGFAALTAALDVAFESGATLNGSLTYSGLGSDVRSWTVGGRFTVPFSGG